MKRIVIITPTILAEYIDGGRCSLHENVKSQIIEDRYKAMTRLRSS